MSSKHCNETNDWIPLHYKVIFLGGMQAATHLACIGLLDYIEDQRKNNVVKVFAAFTGFFTIPFISVYNDPDSVKARQFLWQLDAINWVIWFFAIHSLIFDWWGIGTILP